MASSVQGMRTFGDKPKAFQLEEGGELYYVGSEVYPVSKFPFCCLVLLFMLLLKKYVCCLLMPSVYFIGGF